ncbi:hypothetical protein MLD38_001425 [Melastoma candidum]|uniref:Uncharacterized protein n=1 Tax=Melastoma candidum TaxID=119954 RepID=A0ACB9SD84_9MYRT|nr:hypothetical protein MLD38_001425 [Melastoma candidum]
MLSSKFSDSLLQDRGMTMEDLEDLAVPNLCPPHLFSSGMKMARAAAFFLVALLVCSLSLDVADANELGYGTIRRDPAFCHGKSCLPRASNPYHPGCEKSLHCRGG